MNVFLFYSREEDGCTRRGIRRGGRGLRRGTRKRKKRKEKRTGKKMKRKKKKKNEEDYQTNGMSLVALLKTRLSHFTDYSFTVYRWMNDVGRKMQKTTTENENLKRNLLVKKDKYEKLVHN